jgi:uncharacterized protein
MEQTATRMMHFVAEELSAHMARTPEGFLLCSDVPIARTGVQDYGPGETGIEPGPDGLVHIERKPEEVFRPETIASFNAKPIINDEYLHATGGVTPDNWKNASVGIVLDVRRGEGTQSNLLLSDLLICDAEAIEAVESGKRQVSCGYQCKYITTGEGRGEQTYILGNHLCLVDRARCGIICSIGDTMKNILGKIKCAFESKDKAAFDNALALIPADAMATLTHDAEGEGAGGSHVHVHIDGKEDKPSNDRKFSDEDLEKKFEAHDKRFGDMETTIATNHKAVMDSLEGLKGSLTHGPVNDAEKTEKEKEREEELKAEAKDGADVKAKDSAWMGESFQETVALAEVIAPGISLPTFDTADPPTKTYDAICQLRKRALSFGNSEPATNAMITQVRGGKELTSDGLQGMKCPEARTLFLAVGAMKKAANASDTTRRTATADTKDRDTRELGPKGRPPRTVAELQEYARNYYATQ